jgi:hypothetical protein
MTFLAHLGSLIGHFHKLELIHVTILKSIVS